MAIFNPETKEFYCECGCGEECKPWNTFRHGHNSTVEEVRESISKSNSDLCYLLDEGSHEKRSEARKKFLGSEEGEVWRREESIRKADKVPSDETRSKMRESHYKALEDDPTLTERAAEKMRGENNPNWKGGLTGNYGNGWCALSEYIKIRDNRTCQGCGWRGESFGDLVAHHIDGCFYNTTEYNLITVCYSCNTKASLKEQEEYWQDYYTSKIEEIYS